MNGFLVILSVWEWLINMHRIALLCNRFFLSVLNEACFQVNVHRTSTISCSPILIFPGSQKNKCTKMASAASCGGREAAAGLLGVREQLFPYLVSILKILLPYPFLQFAFNFHSTSQVSDFSPWNFLLKSFNHSITLLPLTNELTGILLTLSRVFIQGAVQLWPFTAF